MTLGRNRTVAVLLGVAASVVCAAWGSRGLLTGSVLAWLISLAAAAVILFAIQLWLDARLPLFIADDEGIRARRGSEWSGLRWQEIDQVTIRPARFALKDGLINVHGHGSVGGVDDFPATVFGWGTRQVDADALAETLSDLADGRALVLIERDVASAGPELPRSPAQVDDQTSEQTGSAAHHVPPVAAAREPRSVVRTEVSSRVHPMTQTRLDPASDEANLQDSEHPGAAAALLAGTGPVAEVSVADPENSSRSLSGLGSTLRLAREDAMLSIEQLSQRTRIRSHVLEAMEVEDFGVVGGDFYARGHLRSLARTLGLDPAVLLEDYDRNFARAPVTAREVFEADFGGSLSYGSKGDLGGPRWTLLAAVVIGLVGVWGSIEAFQKSPEELVSPAPHVVDSVGLQASTARAVPQERLATLVITARGAQSDVVVRDRQGQIIWAGSLSAGQSRKITAFAPFRVTASNAAAVQLRLLGKSIGVVAKTAGGADRVVRIPNAG